MLTDTGDNPANTVAGLEANTLADGFFHLATWSLVVSAMLMIVRGGRAARRPRRGERTVRDDLGSPLGWDLGFLAFGALLVVAGLTLARTGAEAGHGLRVTVRSRLLKRQGLRGCAHGKR